MSERSPPILLRNLLLLVDKRVDYTIDKISHYMKCKNLSSVITSNLPAGCRRLTQDEFRGLLFACNVIKMRRNQWTISLETLQSLMFLNNMTLSTSIEKFKMKDKPKVLVKKVSILKASDPPTLNYKETLKEVQKLTDAYTKEDQKLRNNHKSRKKRKREESTTSDETTSKNEQFSSSCSDDTTGTTLTIEYLSAPLTGEVLQKIEAAEALDFNEYPRIAMNGDSIIELQRMNKRKCESVKIMIVYVAISTFHYDTTGNVQWRKDRRRILNAATRLVCYNEGYAEQKTDMKTIENHILSMDNYCNFDGTPLPIGVPLKYTKAKTKVKRIMDTYPELLVRCFRKAARAISDKASYARLAETMTTYIPILSPIKKGTIRLTRHDFAEFFRMSVGKLKRESLKPRLTCERRHQRVCWCLWVKKMINIPIQVPINNVISNIMMFSFWMRVCFLDEKWFYGSSGRNVRKMIPRQEYESESEAYLPAPTVRSRQYVNKVMFMGVIARPLQQFGMDGKIFLKRISRTKTAKKKSENQKFVPDGNLNDLIKSGDWKNHVEPHSTVGSLFDTITNFYQIDDETSCHLALTYNTFSSARSKSCRKVVLDYSHEDKILLDRDIFELKEKKNGQTANLLRKISIDDFQLKVVRKKGDVFQEDCSCDSEFMLETMREIGDAIRAKYKFLPFYVSIFLCMDNAGGHGTKEAILKYETMLDQEYNIKILHQVPGSPDTNMLDLGGWRSLQAKTEILGYRQRQDPDVLSATVRQAWEEWGTKVLENIYKRWELVLSLIPLDNGGNKFIDSYRGKLTSNPISESDRMSNDDIIAKIKTKINNSVEYNQIVPLKEPKEEKLMDNNDLSLITTSTDDTATTVAVNDEKIERLVRHPPPSKKQRRIPSRVHQQKKKDLPQAVIEQTDDDYFVTLTRSEVQEVENAISPDKSEIEVLAVVQDGKVKLKRYDFLTLRENKWLNDEILQSLFWKLQERDIKNDHHFMKTHFLAILQQHELNTYCYQSVRKWTRNVDIFNKKKIFIPVNIDGQHWALVLVDMVQRRIRYLDSMGRGCSQSTLRRYPDIILQYLKDEWEDKKRQTAGEMNWDEWEINTDNSDTPQQENGYDCGIFTFLNATFLSISDQLTFTQHEVNNIRPKLVLLLLDQWELSVDGSIVRRVDGSRLIE